MAFAVYGKESAYIRFLQQYGSALLHIGVGLKGCAKRFSRAAGTARTYRDLACGAAGVHIVIVAVLYVALDACNMLASAIGCVGLLIFHFQHPF